MDQPPVRILLVDDDEDDFIITSTLLSETEGSHFSFEWAPTYERAMEIIGERRHDVYLVDYNLGPRNGLELLREAIAKGCQSPLILLTGQGGHYLDLEAMQSGAVDYLVKGQTGALLLERSIRYAIDRKNVEETLRESRERYELAVKGSRDGIWDFNIKTNEMYYSERWKAMLGYGEVEIADRLSEWWSRVHADDIERLKREMTAHLEGKIPYFESEYRLLHKDGTYRWMLARGMAIWDREGKAYRMAGSQSDITAKRRDAELLERGAFYDSLTNLPNRTAFMNRLSRAISRLKWKGSDLFAVLFLDIDRFKTINDSLGHEVGDQLLVAISRRLEICLRPGDFVARFGGDEFTMLTEDIRDVGDVTRIATRIRQELTMPFTINGQEVYTDVSIGIALSSEGHDVPDELLRDADLAMYRAKTLGKGRYEFYSGEMRTRAVQFLQLDSDLRRALERHEFRVHYQPIVSLESKKVIGMEALLYWLHPRKGRIPPKEFIPMAEETGVILQIGEWVLKTACTQSASWHAAGHLPFRMWVNVSFRQFQHKGLIEIIKRVLQETGLTPESIGIEITESCTMGEMENSVAVLDNLAAMGVNIAVDDFGTGVSSLAYLKRFPLYSLKIDQSFIQEIGKDHDSNADLITAIISMAHSMRLTVIAEGVENERQLEFLKEHQCDAIQGNLFCQPLPGVTITRLLKEGRYLSREFNLPVRNKAGKKKLG